jgi:hypothetical protein
MATGRVPTTANSPLTAKGDLFGYSTTQARVPVGNDGETIVADSSTSTGLRYNPHIEAGKNFLINGGFDVWQRGTSFTTTDVYSADRWKTLAAAAGTFAQETTTIPSGARYAMKITAGATTDYALAQVIETSNAVMLAGKTITLSVEAVGTAGKTPTINIDTSTTVDNGVWVGGWTSLGTVTLPAVNTSTYVKASGTFTIPSTAKSIRVYVNTGSLTSGQYIIVGNAQLEVGSVATGFSRTGGTIQGELAACQRYYVRFDGASYAVSGYGTFTSTTNAVIMTPLPSTMRIAPSAVDWGTLSVFEYSAAFTPSAVTMDTSYTNPKVAAVNATVSGATAGRSAFFRTSGSTAGFIGYSAEL